MSKVQIQIIMPEGKKLDRLVDLAVLPGIDGDFEVQEGHAGFITKLRPGNIRIQIDEKSEFFAIHEGFVSVENDKILILSENVETKEEIDIERAKRAKERAERRLAERASDDTIDFRRAEAALHRAIARLDAANLV